MTATKKEIRRIVAARKRELPETQNLSFQVINRLQKIKEFETASILMSYVDFGKEVRTVPLISKWIHTKQIVVPYCLNGEISIFCIKNLNELAPGAFGILEPKLELRNFSERQVRPEELEIILVPGTAFDPQGGRVGRGKGYYDRFLAKIPSTVFRVGLAFECQIFPEVPMESYDVRMNAVVTESQIYVH